MKFVAIAALIATTQAVEGVAVSSTSGCDAESVENSNVYCETEVGVGSCCIVDDATDSDTGKCTTTAGAGDESAPATYYICSSDVVDSEDSANKLAAGVSPFLAAALCM